VFEITTFRKDIGSINYRRPAVVEFTESLNEDSLRRDFTINTIYYDILNDKLIDPV
jgi:tRNA nucleotidyltransferase/poly(A) polymerase